MDKGLLINISEMSEAIDDSNDSVYDIPQPKVDMDKYAPEKKKEVKIKQADQEKMSKASGNNK